MLFEALESYSDIRYIDETEPLCRRRVLLRGDCNLPVREGCVIDDYRVRMLLPTLQTLLRNQNKVLLLSHIGRPSSDSRLSMKIILPVLRSLLPEVPIQFVDEDALSAEPSQMTAFLKKIDYSGLLVLENLRFHKGEEGNNSGFAKKLSMLGDVFVNDAFACMHRKHASIVGIGDYLPSFGGLLVKEELKALKRVIRVKHGKKTVLILGGMKFSTKIGVLETLYDHVARLVLGGGIATTVLRYLNKQVGQSCCEEERPSERHLLQKIARGVASGKVILPVDGTVKNGARIDHCAIDALHREMSICDIGPKTRQMIQQVLQESDAVVWNGPMGQCEVPPFDQGTISVATEIARLTNAGRLMSLIGGGETAFVMRRMPMDSRYGYLSTGGGALLDILSGKRLPGLDGLIGAKTDV